MDNPNHPLSYPRNHVGRFHKDDLPKKIEL